ncbi:putative O-acetyltransferase [Polychytrium aggregatum]|uniref:putative O-acetyltransferase n=1 Tax=Polychytrium aggregatum TaxID=110093 RepID=UPI0022FE2328|nr:putative O-acetyltransferase [Polychytrium aggregatum]KAI9202013.1 putative O-acetyltransferase [Polychytrium aggregatum]
MVAEVSSMASPSAAAITLPQAFFALIWILVVLFYAANTIGCWLRPGSEHTQYRQVPPAGDADKDDALEAQDNSEENPANVADSPRSASPVSFHFTKTASVCRSVILLGLLLFFFYAGDVAHWFPRGLRVYSRDIFLFVYVLIFLAAILSLELTPETQKNADQILNRHQTEEWKGWMQVGFLLYHYFRASETYNTIRIFIACYVWMTGFGNFSYFYIRKDYSLKRLFKMLFRLNFLVAVICVVTSNEYMLYYICPMHTFWFLSVYVFMAIKSEWNYDRRIYIKFIVYFLTVVLLWEIPAVGEFVFSIFGPYSPLPILAYKNSLKEWMFRSGLDRYMTLLGMLCAFFYPMFDSFIRHLEMKTGSFQDIIKGHMIKITILVAALIPTVTWASHILLAMNKIDYNKLHPYLAFIPILFFIYVRNITPLLRRVNLHMFAWCGRITLETYIAQHHIWLQDNAKSLLVYPPLANYPMLNFMFATAVYLLVSELLFQITNVLSDELFGTRDPKGTKGLWGWIHDTPMSQAKWITIGIWTIATLVTLILSNILRL